MDGEYSSKAVKYLLKGREFLFKQSLLELEDDLFGIIDEPKNLYILEWTKGNEWVKKGGVDAANKGHTDLMLYWNFLLEREQFAYYRIRYNFMSILEKVGGIMSCISVVMMFIMKPCYYKKHEMVVLQEYERRGLCRDINHSSYCMRLPLDISPLRLFLYDIKQLFITPCKKKDTCSSSKDCSDHDQLAYMNKKMDRINNDNMDIINIMKIDRIE